MGAMRPLVGKLEMLLQAPNFQGCSSNRRVVRVKDGIRLLKDDVDNMSSYLYQLSELEAPPLTAIFWMNEARDLSYDMEDYMDSLIFVRPEDACLVPNNIKPTRSRLKFGSGFKFFGHAKTPKSKVGIVMETLSEFRKYVQEAIKRHQMYNLHSCSTLRRRVVSDGPMLPTPMQHEDIVIDGRMNGFINSLANNGDQQLKVLSVFGPSCLGKTTLARVLYNRLGKQYNCRAFFPVSRKPDMKTIFCDMVAQLQHQQPPRDCKEGELINHIKEYLQDKRYLIIIDDLWATSVWDIINRALPKGSQGSRIVIITQIEDIALTCCSYQSEHVFQMKPLDDDHSRKLFFNRLFGSECYCPEELKEVSNRIVEICDGLPLATSSIANLLASQSVMSIDLLTYIHQSLSSCFSANSTSERMRQVLTLSYNNLPHYLKTCLLYLSMYQKGYTFSKDNLLKQWVAEGLIDLTEGQDIVKVAESYLNELIGRRFVQPICINYSNEVLSCAVHDAVHDLIAYKSAEENFIVAMDCSSRKNVALYQKARRLSLLFGDAKHAKIPSNIRKSQVRSLRFFGLLECMPCIGEFKLLHVLNLQLSGHRHGDHVQAIDITGISELFHLRYLKVVCDVCIKLPNSMRGLQCLETLDVMDTTGGTHVPWDIIYLPHLLHLSLPLDTNLMDYLNAEPHLVCPHLQCLSVSLVSHGMLNHLQGLYIPTPPSSDHVERSMEALGSLIGGHGKLKTMVLAHGSSVRYGGVSKATNYWSNVAPPPCLERFECLPHSGIIFYRIPRWMEQLGNLCILKIAVSELLIYDVGILRGLPALTALSLYVKKVPYDKIIFDKPGFLVLKYFKLRFTSGIAWLKFEADAMPNLLKVKLVFNAIPQMDQYEHGIISIQHMPGLREIYVKFGGAAADLECVSRIGVVSNHPSNPVIAVQLVDSGSHGDESTRQKQPDEILEGKPDEYDKALEIPAFKRISPRSPESPSCMHLPDGRINLMSSMSQKVAITSMSAKAKCSDDLQLARYSNSVPSAVNGQFYMMQNHEDVQYTSSYSISPISGSPLSQHDSHLDYTYNSPPTASCAEVPDFQSMLKELEDELLGPEMDIASYRPNNRLKQDDWRKLLGIKTGDLKQVIIACGKAVAEDDSYATELLIPELGQLVSVSGDPLQRVGAYMLEGLVARLSSSRSKLYRSLKFKEPTSSELMSYMHLLYDICPFYKFGYMSANCAIAEAIKGENFVHIIDFQIAQGSQWVTMIQALAARPGGPPCLRITGIDDSNSAYARGGELDIVGRRLHNVSASCGLPFEFNAVHVASHEVYLEHLDIRSGDVIVVNFAYQLHHIPDESVSLENHRDRILRMIKSLSPRVVTLVEQESNTNTAPFFPRYLETLDYYTAMFESIDVALPRNDERRISTEQHCVARDIVNLIACEGAERLKRYEVFGKWKARFAMARFRPYPLCSVVNNTIKTLLNGYNSYYRFAERDGVLYLGWKNRVLVISSAWC